MAQNQAQEGKTHQPEALSSPASRTAPAASNLQTQLGNAMTAGAVQSANSPPMGNVAALQAGVGNARMAQALAAAPASQTGPQAVPKSASPATAILSPATVATEQEAPVPEPGWLLSKIAAWAKEIPGYHLLSVVLGRDPISAAAVPRNARNLIHGVVGLIPGGNALYQNLDKSAAIGQAGTWLEEQIGKLGLSWANIKGRFGRAWDALSAGDLLRPGRAFDKLKLIFQQPIERLRNFALAAGNKLLEFVLQGAMAQAGGFGKQVMAILKQAGNIFLSILKDPIGFIGNLVKALGKGFKQFSAHIWTHLKAGLMGWLFGALAGTGLQFPARLNLKGIFSLVIQILGLTWGTVRKRIVKVIGEKRMVRLERSVGFVADLANRGLVAAWEMIAGAVGNLKDWVLGAIQDWVVTRVVKSAVVKLVSMFNPAGAIIQAALAIYNTIMFFIERAQQIAVLAQSVFSSVTKIATGAVGVAANFIELSMARTLPVIISFLARLLGLGGIGEKVRGVIKKIQQPIHNAISRVVDFVVRKARGMAGARADAKQKDGKETTRQPDYLVKRQFFMGGVSHTLTMTLVPSTKIEMASSRRGLLSNKIGRTVGVLMQQDPKPTAQIEELKWIGGLAKDLQHLIASRRKDPRTGLNQVPEFIDNFNKLSEYISDYGKKWKTTDIEQFLEESTPTTLKKQAREMLRNANHIPPVDYNKKHWRGNSEMKRRENSMQGKPGQFLYSMTADSVKALEQEAFLTGELEQRPGGGVWAYKKFNEQIGYANGKDAFLLRAEMTNISTGRPDIHSHPRLSRK